MFRLNVTVAEIKVCPDPGDTALNVPAWRGTDVSGWSYGQMQDGSFWMCLPGWMTFAFQRDRDEVQVTAEAHVEPAAIQDTFRRLALPMILQVRGREVLHASAVTFPQGVVALCGDSQVGKSTLAFGLHRRGHLLYADDAIVFEVEGRSVQAVPLPFQVRLREDAATFFDRDRQASYPDDQDGVSSPDASDASSPLSAVCVLTRADDLPPGRSVEICRLEDGQTLESVLPHAYCFGLRDEARKRLMMEQYLCLCACLPVYSVKFRPGLENLDAVLDALQHL